MDQPGLGFKNECELWQALLIKLIKQKNAGYTKNLLRFFWQGTTKACEDNFNLPCAEKKKTIEVLEISSFQYIFLTLKVSSFVWKLYWVPKLIIFTNYLSVNFTKMRIILNIKKKLKQKMTPIEKSKPIIHLYSQCANDSRHNRI